VAELPRTPVTSAVSPRPSQPAGARAHRPHHTAPAPPATAHDE